MKTLQYFGDAKIGLAEKPIPEISGEEVLIKVAYAGICGTDLHIADGHHPRAAAGLIMGHEFSGIVEKGDEAGQFKPGQKVTVEPLISCGHCAACRAGYSHVCQTLGLYGIDQDGAFAKYVKIPAQRVIPMPDEISLVDGALIEPLTVGVHAVRRSSLKSMDTVLIIGGGPIGVFTAIAARAAGASVYVAELNEFRRKLVSDLGFELFTLPAPVEMTGIYEVTDGKGFDVVYDAAGGPATLQAAFEAARVRGEVVMVAMPQQKREISYITFSFKELSMASIRVYEYYDFQRAIKLLLKEKLDLSSLYSVFSLDEYKDAFKAAGGGDAVMRVLFNLQEEKE